jgi:hypothetical protein
METFLYTINLEILTINLMKNENPVCNAVQIMVTDMLTVPT